MLVVHGDVRIVTTPLMIGHYRASRLTGSELILNRMIGGTMAEAMRTTCYPDEPGENQIFANRAVEAAPDLWAPRPEAVIVVGLGAEGSLMPRDLSKSVRRGVLAWAQREREGAAGKSGFVISATLIGSGGARITPGVSARQIVQGVVEANELLEDEQWPVVDELRLVELYLDRASEAWRSVRLLDDSGAIPIALTPEIDTGAGELLRPVDSSYRGAGYDFVSITSGSPLPDNDTIRFEVDARRARSEETALSTQLPLVRRMIEAASNSEHVGNGLGRSLFHLLVPSEVAPNLLGSEELQVAVDAGTAGIPWELLDAGGEDRQRKPWAIRSKLLRQFKTEHFDRDVLDADRDHRALVIGEPRCDPRFFNRLPGARREAAAVAKLLRSSRHFGRHRVQELIAGKSRKSCPSYADVITALMQEPWRIIHIAGHGLPPESEEVAESATSHPGEVQRDMRGIVLSDGVYLGPREIKRLPVVPELVFVNCCSLAARDSRELLQLPAAMRRNHPLVAATVAQALIERGVKCVVAAGWTVEDQRALHFARTFYRSLLAGKRFLVAVAEAREAAWAGYDESDNTWAAYQAYGDPDWTLDGPIGDAGGSLAGDIEPTAISSEVGVINALRAVRVQAEDAHPTPEARRGPARAASIRRRGRRSTPDHADEVDDHGALVEAVRSLDTRCAAAWKRRGDVAEAFGEAWQALREWKRAATWFGRAAAAQDGRASAMAPVQFAQLTARAIHEAMEKRMRGRTRVTPAEVKAAYRKVQLAAQSLELHCKARATVDSLSQCGSTYKRLALIAEMGRLGSAPVDANLRRMDDCYREAVDLARRDHCADLPYPAMARIAAGLHFALVRGGPLPDTREQLEELKSILNDAARKQGFWTSANRIELAIYDAVGRRSLAADLARIRRSLASLRSLFRARGRWSSVLQQARFVLEPYGAAKGVPAAERNAARNLLKEIARHAGDRSDA